TFTGLATEVISAPNAGFVNSAGRDYNLLNTSPARDQATGSTITVDRDNLPRVGVPDLGAYEVKQVAVLFATPQVSVSSRIGAATFTVRLTIASGSQVTVNYATGGGTATPRVDYTPVSGTLVFNPGETVKSFTVPVFVNNAATGPLTVGL